MKTNETPKTTVIHVRLSTYQVAYLKTCYGSPALFPDLTTFSLVLDRFLIPNPTCKKLTSFCYSDAAFNPTKFGGLFSENNPKLSESEKSEYLPVVIPGEVLRAKGMEKTSPFWQLSSQGTKIFRYQAKRTFWMGLSDFYEQCKYRAARNGESVTFEDVASDFLIAHGIGLEHLDNIFRGWRRTRNEIKAQIENHRALIEERCGEELCYTA